MHHGTCVTHVPWCMSGSLTRGNGENVPGIRAHAHPQYYVSGKMPMSRRCFQQLQVIWLVHTWTYGWQAMARPLHHSSHFFVGMWQHTSTGKVMTVILNAVSLCIYCSWPSCRAVLLHNKHSTRVYVCIHFGIIISLFIEWPPFWVAWPRLQYEFIFTNMTDLYNNIYMQCHCYLQSVIWNLFPCHFLNPIYQEYWYLTSLIILRYFHTGFTKCFVQIFTMCIFTLLPIQCWNHNTILHVPR